MKIILATMEKIFTCYYRPARLSDFVNSLNALIGAISADVFLFLVFVLIIAIERRGAHKLKAYRVRARILAMQNQNATTMDATTMMTGATTTAAPSAMTNIDEEKTREEKTKHGKSKDKKKDKKAKKNKKEDGPSVYKTISDYFSADGKDKK
uniref:Uncharacterized protein n=1 Tax=Panagrolaimus sp. JU765 TaxID=591449 RepID=A0AC34Q908_9BILA